VRTVRGKVRLSLRLSEPAELTVVVAELVSGRKVHGRCVARARRGRRCRRSARKLTLHIAARRGSDALDPRMRPLSAGRYAITVVATNSVGEPSTAHTVQVAVRGRA
jgi:hypothetical protein